MWCTNKRDLSSYLQVILRIIGYAHTILDSYCTSRKKLPDRASVHGDFRRDFCNGAKLHPAGLDVDFLKF